MENSPIILAFDPGYDRLGWAVGSLKPKLRALAYGCITTIKTESLTERYSSLHHQVEQVLDTYKPETVAIESLFFNKNVTTGIKVAEVRGIIIGIALTHGCTTVEYAPSQIKLATTGYGKAPKSAIAKMVSLQLRLDTSSLLDDTIDALAILITHSALANRRVI